MLPTKIEVGDCVDKKAKELTIAIRAAMKHSIPKIKTKVHDTYRPWSDSLQILRGKVRRARRIYQKTRVEAEQQSHLLNYRNLKNQFKDKLQETRHKSWQGFVEENMALDAWGTPYRLVTNKIRPPDILSTLTKEDGSATEGWRDSIEYLMNGLLPSDDNNNETEEHRDMRNQMIDETNLRGVVYPFSVEEVKMAISMQKPKKAPGLDGIRPEILQHLASEISPYLRDLYNECLTQGRIPDCFK